MRNLLTRGLPDPAEVEHRSVAEQVWTSPPMLPVRLFWNTLDEFRPYWPVLIPLLALLGIRTYRRERAEYLNELALRDMQWVKEQSTTKD